MNFVRSMSHELVSIYSSYLTQPEASDQSHQGLDPSMSTTRCAHAGGWSQRPVSLTRFCLFLHSADSADACWNIHVSSMFPTYILFSSVFYVLSMSFLFHPEEHVERSATQVPLRNHQHQHRRDKAQGATPRQSKRRRWRQRLPWRHKSMDLKHTENRNYWEKQ